ncbi:MAG: alpha/beta fold hydrolase, partial [Pseudomonadota bacterium]
LEQSMGDVFSVIPPEHMVTASREVVKNYLRGDGNVVGSIHWVEFELDGGFVRGGISDLSLMSSRLVTNWNADPVIREIVDYVREEGIRVGELIETNAGNGHYWCVPYRPRDALAVPADRSRAVLLTEDLFLEILKLFNADAQLTRAERRMIYQILTGLNPTRAAAVDDVSVETKRSHLKAAASKLNCRGQTELVRLLVSQLIHLLYLCESETSHIQLVENFGARYFGSFGRLSVQRLPSGRVMRFWEFGPPAGKPVLAIHGYLFPFLVLESELQLIAHGLRIILPVRTGFLDGHTASEVFHRGQLVDELLEDLAAFIRIISPDPVPLLGHNMGGFYALLLAKKQPELFSTVIIASINLMNEQKDRSSFTSRFWRGYRKLAGDIGIYEIAAKQFQKSVYSSSGATKYFLRRMFRGSRSDLDLLEGKCGSGPAYEWFRQIALHSLVGVSCDFSLTSRPAEEFIRDVPKPVTFLHGAEDPFTTVVEVEAFAAVNPAAACKVLTEGGHYASASHPELFWEAIVREISDRTDAC